MIDFYTFGTTNTWRAAIALEECGLPYRVHKVDFAKGEQHAPAFRKLNPLGKVPVIVDHAGPGGAPITVSQSGAILLYCAEKTGRFLPTDPIQRFQVLQWLIHAVSDGSDAFGGLYRLSRFLPDKPESALAHYRNRLIALLKDVDAHLADRDYLAGDLSIADFALYPVVRGAR